MEVTFADADLDRLETDEETKTKLDKGIVFAYRNRMRLIRDALDERDIRAVTSPKNFYKLSRDRSHQHAFRLNDQWRLIIEIKKGNPKNTIQIVSIEDYH